MNFWLTDMPAQLRALGWRQEIAKRVYLEDSGYGLTMKEGEERFDACFYAERYLRRSGVLDLDSTVADRKKVFEFIHGAATSLRTHSDVLMIGGQVIASYKEDDEL